MSRLTKKTEDFREYIDNIRWFNHNYQYRLLESALIPEEELAKFLVENIDTAWLKSEQSIKFIVFDIF